MLLEERIIDVICEGDISKNCSVKLDNISCDGYNQNMLIGVFSHFHDDHIRYVHKCIGQYDTLVTHPITFEGINALQPGMRLRQQWVPQDYDTKYSFDNGSIRLLKSNHIPGSSQVYVESDGKTMLYSGDFGYPDVQIKNAEYLVLDSTHGDPGNDGQTDRHSIKNRMFEHVEEQIQSTPQIVIQASSGTLQEIMRHFEVGYDRRMRDDIYFVMDAKQDKVLRSIYKDEIKEFRGFVEYDSPEFWKLVNANKRCAVFSTQLEILDEQIRQFHKIMVDRFRFEKRQSPMLPFDGGCRFNLAAHASIDGIYKYVEEVNPKYVVTDNSRGSYGQNLARLIEQRFPRIKTEFRPPR